VYRSITTSAFPRMFTPRASLREFILIKGVFPVAMGQLCVKATRVNQLTNQARNAVGDLIAPEFNRTWCEPGRDLASPFLPGVESKRSRGEGEGKAEKDSVDQEPDVCGVLWSEPGRYESLQTVQAERTRPESHLSAMEVSQRRRRILSLFGRVASSDANSRAGCLAKGSEPNNLIARFSTGMPHSHHSHSGQFCKHAVGTLEDVVVEAVRQGFRIYGLSEHVPRYRTADFYPEEVGETTHRLQSETCNNELSGWPHAGRSHETIRRIH
jgi:hypothetical protein